MRYVVRQNGIDVAQVQGPDAEQAWIANEAMRYAREYAQDGPCEIIGPLNDDYTDADEDA